MLVLSEADIKQLISMSETIEVVDGVMRDVSKGTATLPLRSVMPVGGDNKMGVMPGAITAPQCYGVKLVSLFPDNPARGLSSHRGAMILFESDTGEAIAMMDASLLTAMRTAAASAVATRCLSRSNAERLTILGTGEQAEFHALALSEVRSLSQLTIAGRDISKALALADRLSENLPDIRFSASSDFKSAISGADIVGDET